MVIGTTYICGIVGILSTVVKHWYGSGKGAVIGKDKDFKLVISRYLSLNPGHIAVTVNCRASWLAMIGVSWRAYAPISDDEMSISIGAPLHTSDSVLIN